nr:hypothetical protein [bacterium]
AGQPEIQLYVLFLALLYGTVRLSGLPGNIRLQAAAWALGAVLASALIAAPQIYLFLQFHREAWSFHPPGGNMGLQSPIRVNRFYFSFFPLFRQSPWAWSYRTVNLTWDWVGGYFGLGLLFLAAANWRRGGNRREATLFGCYFLFILAKNLGWSPAQLLGLLPGFDQTWSPRWAAATWSFALAVLAGLGLDNLLERNLPGPAAKPPRPAPRAAALERLRARPVWAAGGLIAALGLAYMFSRLGSAWWEAQRMRMYVFCNGASLFLWVAAALLGISLLPRRARRYPADLCRDVRDSLHRNQTAMAAFLAALGAIALRSFPGKHYLFTGAEPVGSYLFAAPALLASLAGLFFILSTAPGPGPAVVAAVAVPAVFLGGLARGSLEPAALIFQLIFG